MDIFIPSKILHLVDPLLNYASIQIALISAKRDIY